MNKPLWTLKEAKQLLAIIAVKLVRVGFGVGLTGGVLIKGKSFKDLDIILYPLDTGTGWLRVDACKVLEEEMGWMRVADTKRVHAVWRKSGSTDKKHVEVWKTADRRRIDLFFME